MAFLAALFLGANGRASSEAKMAGVDRQAISSFYEAEVRPCGFRGQGYSQTLSADPTLGTIDEFAYLGNDLHQFVATTVRQELQRANQSLDHVYLIAHSMGGAIGALAHEKYPGDFRAAVLSAPMLKLDVRGWNEIAAQIFLDAQSLFGRDALPVTAPRDPSTAPVSQNTVTRSQARYEFQRQVLTDEPSLKIFVSTQRWVRKAIAGSRVARKNGAAARCKIITVQDAKHEIF